MVDDGSPDDDWSIISRISAMDDCVQGIKLSRNFGQHHAISAGLNYAKGRWIIVMDCDLQDPPEEIPRLLEKARQGYDIVLARRLRRQDSWLKRVTSHGFHHLLAWLTETQRDPTVANFGIYHQKVIHAVNSLPEQMRVFPTMIRWVGFKSTTIEINHAARAEGASSYNIWKRLELAADICLAYSDKPLRLVVWSGFVISLAGFALSIYTIILALKGEIAVMGYASLIVSIWVFSGIIISVVGVVGLYVGKTFEGVKRRPAFIVDLDGSNMQPKHLNE